MANTKVLHFLFFVTTSMLVKSEVIVRKCHTCNVILNQSLNYTSQLQSCPILPCPNNCNGLCMTNVRFNKTTDVPVAIFSFCSYQETLCGDTNRRLIDIFRQEEIDGICNEKVDSEVKCTCGTDGCNNITLFGNALENDTNDTQADKDSMPIIIGVCGGVVVLVSILLALSYFRWHLNCLRDDDFDVKMTGGSRLSSDDASLIGWDESGKHSFSTYKYSSSIATQYTRGSRGNALNHNDNHLPIELQQIIGRGRFAEVWKAKLQQDTATPQIVSVKMFRLRDYGAWRQEKDMLGERWMHHENLIEFYASEQHTMRGKLKYWLVTAYYKQGSLAEFLRSNVIGWIQFCDMAISIAKGLSYLHAENDEKGRPKIPIAHRDVKSTNILVKDNCSSCVLADFGLSLKLDPAMSKDELSNAGQVGTSRYMAPELLERLVNLTDIEMFKRIDVYAMALVFWEMANRCEYSDGKASPYMPPFGDQISDHPTKGQMLLLVCRERQKPVIPEKWNSHAGMSIFVSLLNEAWDYEPEARITASCAYERLHEIRNTEVTSADQDQTPTAKELEANKINDLISTVI